MIRLNASLINRYISFSLHNRYPTFCHNMEIAPHSNSSYTIFDPLDKCDRSLSPIIFIHGIAETKKSWKNMPQIVANKTKRKAIAIDVRNHGDSEWTDNFTFEGESKVLLHFMDTINAQKAVLVGYSMGGAIALLTALSAPEKVDGLISVDMWFQSICQDTCEIAIEHMLSLDEALQHVSPNMSQLEVINAVTNFSKIEANEPVNHVSEEFDGTWKRNSSGIITAKHNSKVLINYLKTLYKSIPVPNLLYNGPAFFIYGESSPFGVMEYEENIKRYFPKAKLCGLKDADHSMHHNYPNEITNFIIKCLSKN